MRYRRPALLGVVLVAALAYASVFLTDHVVPASAGIRFSDRWDTLTQLQLLVPFAGVLAAAGLWPRWRLVALVFAIFFLVPIAVDDIEQRFGWYPAGTTAADYEMNGLDHLTTDFLAVMAFPAAVLAAVVVSIRRERDGRAAA